MGLFVVRRVRSRVARRAASLAACLVLVSMTVATAPPVATAKEKQATAPDASPVAALKSRKPAPTEVPSLRTTYSNTYDNHDGTLTSSISAAPINYKPAAGAAYEPIDLNFTPVTGGKGRVRAGHTMLPVEVGAPDDASGFMSIDTGEGRIKLSLPPGVKPGKSGSTPKANAGKSDVVGLMDRMDLSVSAGPAGVRTFFTLTSAPRRSTFAISLDTGGLTPVLNADGTIDFKNKAGKTVASMPHPYAVDSTVNDRLGSGQTTMDVSYSIVKSGSSTLLGVSVDPTWLANAVYPVYVDPTFSGTSLTTDNFVSSKYPTSVFPSYQNAAPNNYWELWLGMDPTNSASVNYDFIKFNLSSIPTSTIDSATLSVYPWWEYYHSSATTTWVNKVSTSWATNSLTWNNQPGSTNVTTAGLTQGQWGSFDVASAVQSWVLNQSTNFGFLLHEAGNNGTYWKRLISSEDPAGRGPRLDVTYNWPSAAASSPVGGGWTNNRTLIWNYYPNGGPAQAGYTIQVAADPSFGSTFFSTNGSGSANSYAIPANVTLYDGTTYYWRVAVGDGYTANWSSVGSFRWDASGPTWNGFAAPAAQVDQASSSYTFAWNAASDLSGVAYYYIVPQSVPIAAPGVCGGGWSNTTNAWWNTPASYTLTGMSSGNCYRLFVNPVDNLGNQTGWSIASSPVLIDAYTPGAPSITNNAGTATGSYQQSPTNIYFRPGAGPGTISLTSTGTDPYSGIASSNFGSLSAPGGWTYTPGDVSGNPASVNLTWSSSSASTTVNVKTKSNAGIASTAATAVNLTADSVGPAVAFTTLTPGSTVYKQDSTYSLSWTESDAGSGLATRSVQRQKGAVATTGTCAGVTWANDGTASSSTSPLGASGLVSGYCYQWVITSTDHVGNSASYTSGSLMIDTVAPAVPSVVATGAGTYQNGANGPVYVDKTTSGTLTLTSNATAPGSVSGVGSSTFGVNQYPTGWTYTPATIPGNPAGTNLGWATNVVVSSLPVSSNTKAGVASPLITVALIPDSAPPTGAFGTPFVNSLTRQNTSSYQVTWTATDPESDIRSVPLQRQKSAVVSASTCPGVNDASWTNDGAASADASGVIVAGLLDGYCYRWLLTPTDNLGHAITYTSGAVLVDTTVPEANLAMPTVGTGQPLVGTVTVKGTATDRDFASYVLEYGSGPAPATWNNLATSAVPVSDDVLGNWVTGSASGVYTIRLTVIDSAGNRTVVSSTVYLDNADRGSEPYYTSVPFDLGGGWNFGVNAATGEASLARTLFSIPGYGPGGTLSLTYDSADAHTGDPLNQPFGAGWSSNLTQYLDVSNLSAGFIVWHRADGAEVPFGRINGTWVALAGHYEKLTSQAGGYAVTYTDLSSVSFDVTGRPNAVIDRYGKALTVDWTLGKATDATGRVTTMTMTGSKISKVVDSAGRTWSFGYTGANLASIVDPAGNETDLPVYSAGTCPGYAGSCLVVSRALTALDASGSTIPTTTKWTVGYDGSGRVASVANPVGTAVTFAYGAAYASGATTVNTPGDSASGTPALTTTYNLRGDARGYVASVARVWTQGVAPGNWTTSFSYDDNGNIASIVSPIDAAHNSTKTFTYNAAGLVASETDPLTSSSSATRTYTYDIDNDLQTETVSGAAPAPALSITTAYVYDTPGHLTCKVQNPTIAAATISCNPSGNNLPVATADSNVVTTYAYDGHDQLIAQTDPLGIVTAYGYDTVGNRTSMTRNYKPGLAADDSTNVVTTYAPDAAGNLSSETDAITTRVTPVVSATTTYTYDALGRILTKVVPGDTWVPSSETVSSYDELGNETLSASCAPAASTAAACIAVAMSKTTTTRDVMGRALSVSEFTPDAVDPATLTVTKPASTATSTTTYDAAGYAWTSVSASNLTTTRTFDGLGHVVYETSAGTWTSRSFDGLGDEIRTQTPASNTTTATTTRTFNPNGTVLTETTDAAGTITYLYDAIGRQIGSVDAAALAVSATKYDALGHATSAMTTNPATSIKDGSTTKVESTVDTAYDADGRVTSTTLPYLAGATPTFNTTAYDALGRAVLTTANYVADSTAPTANLVTQNYYDAAGQLVASLDPKHIATRSMYAINGALAVTIANCTDSGSNDGTMPPADPASCTGNGTRDGSNNVRTQSSSVSGAGEIVATRTVGTTPNTVTATTYYNGGGLLLRSVVDPAAGGLALETDYAYDKAGRLIAQATPAPDGSGKVVKITVFDPGTGRVTKIIDNCIDATPAASWSVCTGTAGQDGTKNLVTTYAYDTAGNVSSQGSPSGAITEYTYDAAGRVTSVKTNGATTLYYYDAGGRKIAVLAPNDVLSSDGVTYSYTVTRYAYDAAGNMVAKLVNCTDSGTTAPTTDSAIVACSGKNGTWNGSTNVFTSYKYDAAGRLISTTAPSPADDGSAGAYVTTDYAYDANGRTCRVLENATGVDATTFGCSTVVSGVTPTNVSTTYTYDKAGNLASTIQPADPASGSTLATTTYAYDGAGHLISQTDGDVHTTTWTYDLLGHKTTETDPDTTGGATVAWFYDAAGRMCRRVAAATNSALSDFSTLAAPCSAEQIDNGVAIDTRIAYDPAGNAKSATDAKTGQVVSATYDAVGRPKDVSDSGGVIGTSDPGTSYRYPSLTTTTRIDPSGTYTFTLDAYGRETAMTNPLAANGAGDQYTWTYGPAGSLVSQTEPLGSSGTTHLVVANTYDALGRLSTRISQASGGTGTVDSQTYTYNGASDTLAASDTLVGNPMSANGTSHYTYDSLGRLTSAAIPTQATATYGWNATPQRSYIQNGTDIATRIATYYTAASHPIRSDPGTYYDSDKEGRLTAQPGQKLKWDNLGRLVELDTTAGSPIATYSYDPLDRLVSIVAGSTTTKYLYVGLSTTIAQTIVTTAGITKVTSHLSDATGTELAQFTDTTTNGNTARVGPLYLGRNGHTDVAFTTDSAGAVVAAALYDPFGKLVSSYGSLPANRWQGSLYDDNSALYYVVARWYAPTLGRFLSVDPVAGQAARPQSLDRYAYVYGNQLGGIDPDGRLGRMYDEGPVHKGSLKGGSAPKATPVASVDDAARAYFKIAQPVVQEAETARRSANFADDAARAGFNMLAASSSDQVGDAARAGFSMLATASSDAAGDAARAGFNMFTDAQTRASSDSVGDAARAYFSMAGTAQQSAASTNIAAEDKLQELYAACHFGTKDQAACNAMNDVQWKPGDPIGTAIAAGGAAIDYGVHHPTQVLVVGGVVLACATGVGCAAVAMGAAAGAAGYTAQYAGTADWNPDDLASNALIGEIGGATIGAGVGGWQSFVGRHVGVAGITFGEQIALVYLPVGAIAITENMVGNAVTGKPTVFSQGCSSATSVIPGFGSVLGSVLCGTGQR